jgi:transposase
MDEEETRLFIEAIYYLDNNGCKIRSLPEEYGNCHVIHQRYMRWCRKGIWEGLFKHLQDPDMQEVMIDGSIVRAHRCAAGYKKNSAEEQCLGRSCGGFSTKINLLGDALGNAIKFVLCPGNKHDITQAEELTEDISNTKLLADKAYDSQEFRDYLEEKNCEAVIPSRSNSKNPRVIDKDLYKERRLVECFFGKLKEFRRVFSRFDKTAISYISYVHFAASIILLR